jgi:hypothetical protein
MHSRAPPQRLVVSKPDLLSPMPLHSHHNQAHTLNPILPRCVCLHTLSTCLCHIVSLSCFTATRRRALTPPRPICNLTPSNLTPTIPQSLLAFLQHAGYQSPSPSSFADHPRTEESCRSQSCALSSTFQPCCCCCSAASPPTLSSPPALSLARRSPLIQPQPPPLPSSLRLITVGVDHLADTSLSPHLSPLPVPLFIAKRTQRPVVPLTSNCFSR